MSVAASPATLTAAALGPEVALAARARRRRRLRDTGLGVIGVLLFVVVWEGVKAVGGPDSTFLEWRMPISTDDASMPHLWTVLRRFAEPEVRGSGRTVFAAVASGMWFSFRLAIAGFIVGVLVGLALAVVMQRFKLVERAWSPYVVLSQTVPLIALAPLIVGLVGQIKIGGFQGRAWMSVTVMSAYLSFFPVAVGALRGLQSPNPQSVELMRSLSASSRQTLLKLRFPAAVAYLLPALKLAAAASIVGTIVAEISSGMAGGIGRLILDYFQKATGDPARVFTAFLGAAALGLIVAGLIAALERLLMRNRPKVEIA
jgi:NitT/TauT family transport system permease protein